MDLMENYWYIIAEASELGRKPMQLKRLGKTLVLWRDSNNKVQCIDDRCPHRGASLSLGKIKNDFFEGRRRHFNDGSIKAGEYNKFCLLTKQIDDF